MQFEVVHPLPRISSYSVLGFLQDVHVLVLVYVRIQTCLFCSMSSQICGDKRGIKGKLSLP